MKEAAMMRGVRWLEDVGKASTAPTTDETTAELEASRRRVSFTAGHVEGGGASCQRASEAVCGAVCHVCFPFHSPIVRTDSSSGGRHRAEREGGGPAVGRDWARAGREPPGTL